MADPFSDLFLLHPEVAALPEIGLVTSRVRHRDNILIAPKDNCGLWTLSHGEKTRSDDVFERFLGKLQVENLVVFFWPSWDENLNRIRNFLSGQADYRISYLVVICGPVEASQSGVPECPGCEVLFIGNEDVSGGKLTEQPRSSICADLLMVMMDLGLAGFAGAELELFGEDPSLRVVGEGEVSKAPFTALGLEAWFPRPMLHIENFRISLAHLLKEDFDRAAEDLDSTLLKKRAGARMEELKVLSTAGLGEGDDAWPQVFVHQTDRWRLPIVRDAALQLMERRIEETARDVELYRRTLVQELDQWGARIRSMARKELNRCLNDESAWLGNNASIGRLAHLLMHYYPGYAKETLPYLNSSREVCLPSDAPDAVETARHFHMEALKVARGGCTTLPSGLGLIGHLAIPLLLSAVGWWVMSSLGLRWWWQASLPCLALAYDGLRYWLWRKLARKIVEQLSEYYGEEANKLADIFRGKLRWLRAKAALAVVRQFAARNRQLGGRLDSMFNQAFDGWMRRVRNNEPAEPSPDEAILKAVRSELGGLAKVMADAAVRNSWNATFSIEVAEQLRTMTAQTYSKMLEGGAGGSAKRRSLDDLIACQQDRSRPLLAAKVAESDLDPRIWIRCLPNDHNLSDEHIGKRRTGFAGDRFLNLKGPIPGPAMLCLKRRMSFVEFDSALKVSDIR